MADVYVEAHRKVSEDDLKYLRAYNALVAVEIDPLEKIIEYLREALGNDERVGWGGEINMPTGETISVRVRGVGDVEYGNGMIIRIADLPPGTVALRIYMM